jgi:hypothetical protein
MLQKSIYFFINLKHVQIGSSKDTHLYLGIEEVDIFALELIITANAVKQFSTNAF